MTELWLRRQWNRSCPCTGASRIPRRLTGGDFLGQPVYPDRPVLVGHSIAEQFCKRRIQRIAEYLASIHARKLQMPVPVLGLAVDQENLSGGKVTAQHFASRNARPS